VATPQLANSRVNAYTLLALLRSSVLDVFQIVLGPNVNIVDLAEDTSCFERTAIVSLAGSVASWNSAAMPKRLR